MGRLSVGPGVQRGDPAIYASVSAIVARLPYDYVVISWNRPGSKVAGTGSTSLHASGRALDIRPVGYRFIGASPCGGSQLDPESMRKLDVLHRALGNTFDENLWRTCTGGNHYDHDHVGDDDGANIPDALKNLVGMRFQGNVESPLQGLIDKVLPLGVGVVVIILAVAVFAIFLALKAYTGGVLT